MSESMTPNPEPMTNKDEQRIRELLDMHPALLQPEAIEMRRHLLDAQEDLAADHAELEQWRATFGESALRDGLARMARVEAERDAARAQLAAFVPPGALSAGETPALCGTCKELLCVPGLPGCARCVKADIARRNAELAAYHAAAESTDLEGDVGDHLSDLADWETETGGAPDWLVDAVIGLIAPVKAERDRLAEQEKRVRELHPRLDNPTSGCCAKPKVCTKPHPAVCNGASHGLNRPVWPCAEIRALDGGTEATP